MGAPFTDLKKALLQTAWIRKAVIFAAFGGNRFECPICSGRFRRMRSTGYVKRDNAVCPMCWSFERHRLLYLFLKERTSLFSSQPASVLHIAAETCFKNILRRQKNLRYVCGNISPAETDVALDLTNLPFPDRSFDIVMANHVLEHIPDDAKAMREVFRVLKPGGWALLQVPVQAEKTYEDFSITTPEGRIKAFGQEDHVRTYGKDYTERLRAAGFHVSEEFYAAKLPPDLAARYNVDPEEPIHFCRKN